MLIQASFEAGRVENAIQLRGLPVLSMDPAENFGWGVPVVFSMPMSPVRLIVVIGDPTIMLDAHVFPRFGLFEVKISHSALDIERRLDIAHPRLALGNILFTYAQRFVDSLGLLGLEDGAIIADQRFWRSMETYG